MSSEEKKVGNAVEGASNIDSSVKVSCPAKPSFKPVLQIAKDTVFAGGVAVERVKVTCKVEGSKFEGKGALTWPEDTIALHKHATNDDPFGKDDRLDGKNLKGGVVLHLQPLKAGEATVKLSLEETGEGVVDDSAGKHSVKVEEAKVAIKHSDGQKDPRPTLLAGNNRKFKAIGTPLSANRKFTWAMTAGAEQADVKGSGGDASVTGKAAGDATVGVTMTISGPLQNGTLAAKHDFKVVDVKIRDADGSSDPATTVLRGTKRTYKAVVDPAVPDGKFKWQGVKAKLTVAADDAQTVEVTGVAESPGNELKLRYTLDDQFVDRTVTIAVTELKVNPPVVTAKVDRKDGSDVELTAKGAPDEVNLTWTLADNAFQAALKGDTNKPKARVTAKQAGAVVATVTYKSGAVEQKASGGAVFVDAFLESLKAEAADATPLTVDSKTTDKKVSVLLGLPSDPPKWTLGFVTAAVNGAPDKIDLCGMKKTGSCTWALPDDDGFVRVADKKQQPKDHGADKTKVLLRALPKSDDSGLDAASVTEKVVAEYTMLDSKATDELSVVIHRDGCSGVKWLRRGAAVTEADQPVICTHGATAQCTAITKAVELAGEPESNGHQHGGLCPVCSTAEDPPPRKIWHYVKGHDDVLEEARDLSDAIVKFVYENKVDERFEKLLTDSLEEALRHPEANGYKSRMLGVLRGVNKSGKPVWLCALSGVWKNAHSPWSLPLWFKGNSRQIPSFAGDAREYDNGSAPFDTEVMSDGFGKVGRCAAPVLLADAMNMGLTNIELAEVWVDLAEYPSKKLPYMHNYEIGSCPMCRTILGRMICEAGG
jgi:hypothetical protein